MHVHEVGDERRHEPRVVERRAGEARRAVVQRAHPVEQVRDHAGAGVGRGARTVEVDGRVPERHDDTGVRSSARVAAKPGSASGASVTRRTRSPYVSRDAPEEREVGGAQHRRRMRAGRAAEERSFEVHAEHHVGPRRAHRAARSSMTSYTSSGALQIVSSRPVVPRATSASTAFTHLLDRRAREVDRAGAVDLHVDEAGGEQRVAEIDRVRRRGARAGGDDPAVGDR